MTRILHKGMCIYVKEQDEREKTKGEENRKEM